MSRSELRNLTCSWPEQTLRDRTTSPEGVAYGPHSQASTLRADLYALPGGGRTPAPSGPLWTPDSPARSGASPWAVGSALLGYSSAGGEQENGNAVSQGGTGAQALLERRGWRGAGRGEPW